MGYKKAPAVILRESFARALRVNLKRCTKIINSFTLSQRLHKSTKYFLIGCVRLIS